MKNLRAAMRQLYFLVCTGAAATLAVSCFAPSSTETATANGDTRTLHLYHTHTGESIDATFRVDGHYDPAVLRQLNHFLRDWRNNDEHEMDPRLFDAVWEAYRTAGATDPIQIYSAYRSPETNAMLRRRSRAVAEHSQHMLGKAMDTTMPGFPMQRIREAGMRLEHGGVGWYPSANFVHLDVGGVRSWPRMSYDQLARLFPDGKTVHVAADGRTLPGYDQARIDIAERGGTEVPPAQESGGFLAWLFGGGGGGGAAHEDEEDRRAPVAVASAAPPAQPAPQAPVPSPALAYAAPPETQVPSQVQGQVAGQQVASAEPTDAPPPSVRPLALVTPMPPPRPADLVADATPDVPLPPVRPDALDHLQTASIRFTDAQSAPLRADPVGGLIMSSASGVPMIRRSQLPAIITHGGGDHTTVPNQALAFASSEPVPDLRPVPMPVARPAGFGKPLALRSARRRPTVTESIVPGAPMSADVADASELPPTGLAGPQLTGLRKAARMLAEKASL